MKFFCFYSWSIYWKIFTHARDIFPLSLRSRSLHSALSEMHSWLLSNSMRTLGQESCTWMPIILTWHDSDTYWIGQQKVWKYCLLCTSLHFKWIINYKISLHYFKNLKFRHFFWRYSFIWHGSYIQSLLSILFTLSEMIFFRKWNHQ